jgi:hypothetical protein
MILEDRMEGPTNEGLILVIFSPELPLTHSLLMKRPVGWMYFRPFGAVSSTVRSDIVDMLLSIRGTRVMRGRIVLVRELCEIGYATPKAELKQDLEGERKFLNITEILPCETPQLLIYEDLRRDIHRGANATKLLPGVGQDSGDKTSYHSLAPNEMSIKIVFHYNCQEILPSPARGLLKYDMLL